MLNYPVLLMAIHIVNMVQPMARIEHRSKWLIVQQHKQEEVENQYLMVNGIIQILSWRQSAVPILKMQEKAPVES